MTRSFTKGLESQQSNAKVSMSGCSLTTYGIHFDMDTQPNDS